jgi:aspartate aminotransferase-like enzyme
MIIKDQLLFNDSTSKPLLFSPGPVASQYNWSLTYSHRSEEFERLYSSVKKYLTGLSGYKNVIFVQGSASCAIETVLSSVLKPISRLLVLVNGEFGRRVSQIAAHYTNFVETAPTIDALNNLIKQKQFDFVFAVQFETSLSIYNNLHQIEKICANYNIHLIVDTVSAFPFYNPPTAKFMISSSAKQLRGLPAMGLIFYDNIDDLELLDRSDYLSLQRYITYATNHQTPHTSLIPQFYSLFLALENMNLSIYRNQIIDNSLTLTEGLSDLILNEYICPVVTLSVKDTETFLNKLSRENISLYQNLAYTNSHIQVGCFNYDSTENYARLNKIIHSFRPL